MPSFSVQSDLPISASELYPQLLSMAGVNYELAPLVRMTVPIEWSEKDIDAWPTGEPLFSSTILMLGFIPIDRHHFKLHTVDASGFQERSSSLTHRQWNHRRLLEPIGDVCRVTDEVEFVPKLTWLGALMKPIYKAIFMHRHRRLAAKYGTVSR